jgi:hypothetical protein
MLVHTTSWTRSAPVIGGSTRMVIHAGRSLAGKLFIEASQRATSSAT